MGIFVLIVLCLFTIISVIGFGSFFDEADNSGEATVCFVMVIVGIIAIVFQSIAL